MESHLLKSWKATLRNISIAHLEVVQEFFERHVPLNLEAVPQRPFGLVVFLSRGSDGFGKCEERQSEIHKPVFIRLNLLVT